MKNKLKINESPKESKQDKKDKKNEEKEKSGKEEYQMVSFFQLYRYATGFDKLLMFIGALASVGTGACQPINMLVFGTLTGDVIAYATVLLTPGVTEEMRKEAASVFLDNIQQFSVYNSLIGVAMFVLSYLSTVLYSYSGIRQILKVRTLYMERVLNQDIGWYDKNQTGDFASRMSDDLSKLEEGLGEKVSMFLHYQIAFVASLILALVKGWELALICLISLPVTSIALGVVAVLTSRLAKKEMDAYGSAGAIAEEVLSTIRTVVSFGGQKKELERYNANLVFARNNNIKRSFLGGIGFGILWFFIYASYSLAFWYGVRLILEERPLPDNDKVYTPGNMVTVFFSVMTGSMNFGMSSPYIETFGIARGAATKIFGVIDNEPIINKSKNNGKKPDKISGNIKFSNVYFDYPNRQDVKILQGLSLSIDAGQTVALVGSSGCGKSTCIQLIQRFYDPLQGNITLDGCDLKELDLTWLRSNIGVVGQEPVLFATTIEENIRYGYKEASYEDIVKAAKKANAHAFISALPHGYKTMIGERGAQLSGGQKQRIAIARALVREPTILLLDEATSALDTNSEAKVQAALDNASKECTTIIVAHRLSTIRQAHKIVVIKEGRVSEVGTHNELMEKKGEYYNLVTTQVSTSELTTNNDKVEILPEEDIANEIKDAAIAERNSKMFETEANDDVNSASLWSIMKMSTPEWWQILIGCITSIIMGAAMPVFAVLFGEILGILSEPDEDKVVEETNLYCIYFLVAGVITGIATFLQIYMFGIAGEKLTMRLRGLMFEAMLKQEMGWFDQKSNGVGALCAKLSGEAASVQGATGQRIGTILQSMATLFLAVGLSMFYEWRLGLLALAFTPFILLATFLQQRLLVVENKGFHDSLEKSTKLAVEAVSSVRTVVSLGCEDDFYNMYVAELIPHHNKQKKNAHIRAGVLGLARSLMFFAFSACMYYGGTLIHDENLDYTKVFKVSQSLIMGTVSIANALAFAPNFQKGLTAAAKIFNLLSRVPKIQDTPTATTNQWKNGNIKYKDVFFSYPTRLTIPVLNGLNLDITNGQTVALVGPSGCGKSTIIQLIERFYDPADGVVTVDNEDIKDMKLTHLRRHLGIVSQEPNLFDRTIGENIAYGDNSRNVTSQEIIEAAKKANIHNFIASLPAGYDTRLGEKGAQLSGGQKQRVAIARALVRNPKILLLDEATSALDAESEKVVQEALDKAKEGRTCITIAHRLTTIQDADVICVVSDGQILEKGKHQELLAKKGLYHRLHTLQSGKKSN